MANRIQGRAVLAAITSLALVGALLLVVQTPSALAEDQANDLYPSVFCGTGDTREEAWHWVHNQVPDGVTSATLTARFEVLTGPDTGATVELQVEGDIGNNIHYDLFYPYGLKLLPTPSDDVDGGMLVLSHWPDCPDSTTTTAGDTTTTAGETTTTAGETTTTGWPTTTDPYEPTTTTEPYQTTTTEPYQTTTTAGETTTTAGETTTTAGETTTTAGEPTTTGEVEDTSTTVGETTTTDGGEKVTTTDTSIPDEVLPTVVTTTTNPEVLPFTGLDSGSLVMWASLLLIIGVMSLVAVKGSEESE